MSRPRWTLPRPLLACLALLAACDDDFANFEGDDLFDVVIDGAGSTGARGREVRLVIFAPDGEVVVDRTVWAEHDAFVVGAANALLRGDTYEVVLHVDLDADGRCGGADDVRVAAVGPVQTDVRLGRDNLAPDPSACGVLPA